MKRKFLKNLLLLIFLNLLVKPFWVFGIDRSVQNIVGSEKYGFYFSLLGFSLLFNILLDLGITNFNNRSISQDPTFYQKHFSNIVVAKLLFALVYGVISFVVALLLGYRINQLNLLMVLILNQFLSSFILYLRSNISGLQFYTTDSLLSVTDRFFMIIMCSMMIWGHVLHRPVQIEWFVYIQTLSYILAMIIIGIVLFMKSRHFSFSFDKNLIVQIIQKTIPYAILGFLISIYNRIDSVLLERLLPDGQMQAGIYAQSFRLLDAFSNFSLLFASLLLPMFANLLGARKDFLPLLKVSFSLLFLICIAVSFSCMAFSHPIISALYHQGHDYSASVFTVLVLSFIPISINYIFGTLLTANGSLRIMNYAALGAVCLNIILNMALIPRFKAPGAAITSLITQSLITVAQIIICFRIWKFEPGKVIILKYAVFVFVSISITYIFSHLDGNWVMHFMGSMLSICIFGMIGGILPMREFGVAIKQQLKDM